MNTRAVIVALLAVLVIPTAVACGSSENATSAPATSALATPTTTTTTTAAPATVVHDVLDNDMTPPGAPDSTLSLVRYTIPAGAKLARHMHPGVLMASIESGTLTYTVMAGYRAGPTRWRDHRYAHHRPHHHRAGARGRRHGGRHHGAFRGEQDERPGRYPGATLLTAHGHELAEPVPAR